MNDSMRWLPDEIASLQERHLLRQLAQRDTAQDASIELNGTRLLNFGSNDYLGLAHTCLTSVVESSLRRTGWGSGASALISGRAAGHARLEAELARFEAVEAALLFPTGFAANLGAICAVSGKPDVVFSDAKNHASIIDGCRLSGATIRVYPHADADGLAEMLARAGHFRRRLIVTDGLFSMDGDLAPLSEIVELADRFDATLMVDEAHATGVFGDAGRGTCEHFGVEDRVPIRVGTLSKALGSMGGFVVGSQSLITWLSNRARPYVFSTAAPEVMALAGIEALRIVEQEPGRRQTLLKNAHSFRQALQVDGHHVGATASHIIPIVLGDAMRTLQAAADLQRKGFFVPAIRPPSVPEGESLLRISLSYCHTAEMIQQLREALADHCKV